MPRPRESAVKTTSMLKPSSPGFRGAAPSSSGVLGVGATLLQSRRFRVHGFLALRPEVFFFLFCLINRRRVFILMCSCAEFTRTIFGPAQKARLRAGLRPQIAARQASPAPPVSDVRVAGCALPRVARSPFVRLNEKGILTWMTHRCL